MTFRDARAKLGNDETCRYFGWPPPADGGTADGG